MLTKVYLKIKSMISRPSAFEGSTNYWIQRYASGGNSGPGFYNHLAAFKAEVLNSFVAQNNIKSIIEFGCGDGNQLLLANYPKYLGFDISPLVIDRCRNLFKLDEQKSFRLLEEYKGETAELALSLDVIFHLVEDDIYESYMNRLFASADKFVVIYSSNFEDSATQISHVRGRKFTDWIDENLKEWKLDECIPNRYKFDGNYYETSRSDFYIYRKSV